MSGLEVISVAQMRFIDARAAELGAPVRTLMENAGRAVAAAAQRQREGRPVTVLTGPGANGGDGWVAARALAHAGVDVRVHALAAPEALKGEAADAARGFNGALEQLGPEVDLAGRFVVDALFGAGLSRPLEGAAAAFAARSPRLPVLAVDVPSGLPGDGDAPAGPCVQACATVTFVALKPAHLLEPGKSLCGGVEVVDIGAPPTAVQEANVQTWRNAPRLWLQRFPWPSHTSHKHQRGHVQVLSGPAGRTGAARLAARGALRAGAGLVSVVCDMDARPEHAARLDAIMIAACQGAADRRTALSAASAIVVGPALGLGGEAEAALEDALGAGKPCVLDADALTLLSRMPRRLPVSAVMTPHEGEFARLAPGLADRRVSKLVRARRAAADLGATLVLKGPDTVIASPDGRAVISVTGSPFLATAGSGDVLAGIIAALMGQGMAPFEAAAAGVWLHGAVGAAIGPGLIAEDLPEALPALLRGFKDGSLA